MWRLYFFSSKRYNHRSIQGWIQIQSPESPYCCWLLSQRKAAKTTADQKAITTHSVQSSLKLSAATRGQKLSYWTAQLSNLTNAENIPPISLQAKVDSLAMALGTLCDHTALTIWASPLLCLTYGPLTGPWTSQVQVAPGPAQGPLQLGTFLSHGHSFTPIQSFF